MMRKLFQNVKQKLYWRGITVKDIASATISFGALIVIIVVLIVSGIIAHG